MAKELALEAAQVRVAVLERRLARAEEEREHFHAKAKEYKGRMLAQEAEGQQQQKQVGNDNWLSSYMRYGLYGTPWKC